MVLFSKLFHCFDWYRLKNDKRNLRLFMKLYLIQVKIVQVPAVPLILIKVKWLRLLNCSIPLTISACIGACWIVLIGCLSWLHYIKIEAWSWPLLQLSITREVQRLIWCDIVEMHNKLPANVSPIIAMDGLAKSADNIKTTLFWDLQFFGSTVFEVLLKFVIFLRQKRGLQTSTAPPLPRHQMGSMK